MPSLLLPSQARRWGPLLALLACAGGGTVYDRIGLPADEDRMARDSPSTRESVLEAAEVLGKSMANSILTAPMGTAEIMGSFNSVHQPLSQLRSSHDPLRRRYGGRGRSAYGPHSATLPRITLEGPW